jgi:integrase
MRPRGNEFGVYPKNIHGSVIFYYWVYDATNKRCFYSTRKRTYDEAVKYCKDLLIKGQLLRRTPFTFTEFTKEFFIYEKCPYINHRILRGYTYSHSWAKRQQRLLETVIRPYFNGYSIHTISFKDIDRFMSYLREQNFSNKKINHVITTVKSIFTYAEMNKVIENNPCKGLKLFNVNSPEKGILTRKELQELFSEENRASIWPEKIFFIFNYLAASTGLRLGEILALKPQDLTNDYLIITHSFNPDDGLKSTKNGKSRVVPLDKKNETLLKDLCHGKREDDFIFSANNGKSPFCHRTIYKSYKKALELIGITKEERKQRNITFHSYRHGVNTMLLESGNQPETVRLLLGHSNPSMTAHYSHLQMPNISITQESYTDHINESEKSNEGNGAITPSYIKQLIDRCFLYPDGKRVVKSLDSVAMEMQRLGLQPTELLLSELFRKAGGNKYSKKACHNAISCANSV